MSTESQEASASKFTNNNNNSASNNAPRLLAAFDFDYTIVSKNTDTIVRDMLPPHLLPAELDKIIETKGWTEYMAEIFRLLHQHHYTPMQICDTVRCIPEVPGFVRLLKRLHRHHNCDIIIISDSNSVFIAEWLRAHGLTQCITRVFTNPAQFEVNGKLAIDPFHHQTECRMSAANLCKGKVLEHFLIEQDLRHNLRYARIVYVGDGSNDLCPVLRLNSADIACARLGFALDKNLAKKRGKQDLRAKLLLWQNGFDLFEHLETLLLPLYRTAPPPPIKDE